MFKKALIWGMILGLMAGISQAEWWKFWEKEKPKKKVEQQRVVQKSSKNIKTQNPQARVSSKQNKRTSTDPAQQLLDEGNKYYVQAFTYGTMTMAIAKYQELIDKYPDSPLVFEALDRMSLCYVSIGKFFKPEEKRLWNEKAIEVQKEIIKRYPTGTQSLDSYFLIGLTYAGIEEYASATTWFLKAIEKYNEYNYPTWEIEFSLVNCYIDWEKYEEALAILQDMIAKYPDHPGVKYYHWQYATALCYEGLKRYDEAIEIFKNTLEKGDKRIFRDPDIITFHIGELYEIKGDYKQAKIWYQKVIDNYPDHPDIVENAQEKLEELANKIKKR